MARRSGSPLTVFYMSIPTLPEGAFLLTTPASRSVGIKLFSPAQNILLTVEPCKLKLHVHLLAIELPAIINGACSLLNFQPPQL